MFSDDSIKEAIAIAKRFTNSWFGYGLAFQIIFTALTIFWLEEYHGHHLSRHQFLWSGIILMIVWLAWCCIWIFIGWLWSIRHCPVCTGCGKLLYPRDLSNMLDTGHCPHCNTLLFDTHDIK